MVYNDTPGAEVEDSGTVERRKDQETGMNWHQWSAMTIVIDQQISHCAGLQLQQERSRGRSRCRDGPGRRSLTASETEKSAFHFRLWRVESFKWIVLDTPLPSPGAAKESFIFLFKSLVRSLLKYHINQHVLRPNSIFQASHNSWRVQVPEVESASDGALVGSSRPARVQCSHGAQKGLVLKATVFKYLV